MPIYEYACQACDHRFEAIQRMSDNPLTDCPSCNQAELKKLISAAGFRLKGGGWYETDFKSKDRRNVAGADGTDGSSEKKSTETKTADSTKPAAKSESKTATATD